jgi:hypothetical protein
MAGNARARLGEHYVLAALGKAPAAACTVTGAHRPPVIAAMPAGPG